MGDPVDPLAALTRPVGGAEPFLATHQAEAARRFAGMFRKAMLQPRVTQSFDGLPKSARGGGAAEISDMAAEARARVSRLLSRLPRDCAGVVLDVCGFEKGLQTVETERGWPRRSAKLVLRIGLEQIACDLGLAPRGEGDPLRATRGWVDEGARPTEVG